MKAYRWQRPATRALPFLLALSVGLCAHPANAGIEKGRAVDPNKTWSLRLSLGELDGIDGEISETKRAGATAITTEGQFLSSYSFEDLGFVESTSTIGFEVEKNWSYFTLHVDAKYSKVDATATADRIYAIGVEDISFGGTDYEYMLIPTGQEFESELEILMVDFKGKLTPFHLASGNRRVSFSPWLILGLYAVGGEFTVDAGPARGVTTFEIDPFPYVINGRGTGKAGGLLPEIGLGAELRFAIVPMQDDFLELALQADYVFLDVAASSGDFGVNARNEKNVDTHFTNFELRGQLEIPLSADTDLLLGLGMKTVEADAEIEADRGAFDSGSTEKYDKSARVQLDSYFLFAGLKF